MGEKNLKTINDALKKIKADYAHVIKGCEIPELVNMRTGETTGHAVILQLSTKYDYDEDTIDVWKQILQAEEWYLKVKHNQLRIVFKVRLNQQKK